MLKLFKASLPLLFLLSACGKASLPPTLVPTVLPTHTEILDTPTPTAPPPWVLALVSGVALTRPADGMLMLDVPAGAFDMGSDTLDADERPVHTVTLDEFWIDQTEVTNAMYALCVDAGVCTAPMRSSSSFHETYFRDPKYADYPVIYVNQAYARAYCSWVGARLPTEAEWEKAARGTDGRTYPWGNADPSCSFANYQGCGIDVANVGSFPAGASPYGALDMAGNVWEFTSDWYGENYYSVSPSVNPQGPAVGDGGYVVLRGASWVEGQDFLPAAYRLDDGPTNANVKIGFRCAGSLP